MNSLSLFGQMSNDTLALDMSNVATDGVILGIIIFFIAMMIVAYAIVSYLLSRIFKKAGIAGWKAWIPVYSTWITMELGGQRGWISLLLLSPVVVDILSLAPGAEPFVPLLLLIGIGICLVAIAFLYTAMYKIGLHFGKDGYFVLWAIFLPIVWYAWLAFDQSTWKESVVTAQFHPTGTKNDDSQPS